MRTMDLLSSVKKRFPTRESIPKYDEISKSAEKIAPRSMSFLKRRIRLRGNSRISIPLGIVLLFPCIALVIILVLVVKHSDSPGTLIMPAGAPPAVRYAILMRHIGFCSQ